MGLFFTKISDGKYWHYKQRLPIKKSIIVYILFLAVIYIIRLLFNNMITNCIFAIGYLLIFIFGTIFAIESIYYKDIIPKRAKKEKKEIIFMDTIEEGIKIKK